MPSARSARVTEPLTSRLLTAACAPLLSWCGISCAQRSVLGYIPCFAQAPARQCFCGVFSAFTTASASCVASPTRCRSSRVHDPHLPFAHSSSKQQPQCLGEPSASGKLAVWPPSGWRWRGDRSGLFRTAVNCAQVSHYLVIDHDCASELGCPLVGGFVHEVHYILPVRLPGKAPLPCHECHAR